MFKIGQLVCYKKYAGVYQITGESKEEVFEERKGRTGEATLRTSYTVQDVNDPSAHYYRAFEEEIGPLKETKLRSSESKHATALTPPFTASISPGSKDIEEDWAPFYVFVTSFSRSS